MEEGIKLSEEMMLAVQNAIVAHDDRAKDPGMAVQYHAAMMGFMIGQQDFPYESKKEYLGQLCEFAFHVLDDIAKPEPAEPEAGAASGIWKPGDK